jgi:hypothetical protein
MVSYNPKGAGLTNQFINLQYYVDKVVYCHIMTSYSCKTK